MLVEPAAPLSITSRRARLDGAEDLGHDVACQLPGGAPDPKPIDAAGARWRPERIHDGEGHRRPVRPRPRRADDPVPVEHSHRLRLAAADQRTCRETTTPYCSVQPAGVPGARGGHAGEPQPQARPTSRAGVARRPVRAPLAASTSLLSSSRSLARSAPCPRRRPCAWRCPHAVSLGSQRPPTPTVALVAALRAAFSAVHSGSSGQRMRIARTSPASVSIVSAIFVMACPS